jgi:hypothetical protein
MAKPHLAFGQVMAKAHLAKKGNNSKMGNEI